MISSVFLHPEKEFVSKNFEVQMRSRWGPAQNNPVFTVKVSRESTKNLKES